MSVTKRTAARSAAVLVTAVVAAAGAATGAAAAPSAVAKTPHLNFTISKAKFKLNGPTSFQAGRVAISLTSVGAERSVQFVSFKGSYTLADFKKDLKAFGKSEGPKGPTKAGLKHLNNAIKHSNLYGGLDADKGKSGKGTVVLPKAGTYYAYDDNNGFPKRLVTLKVTGPAVKRADPGSTGTIKALNHDRFGGDKTLPANGTITYKNTATDSPHFLFVLHVKEGTTKKDVEDYFASGSQKDPKFALPGGFGTDTISPGISQTVTYHQAKGEYIELCFFPDPKTGVPHAFMGMIKVVHLK